MKSAASETSEQMLVVRKLREANIKFFHVPNGGKRDKKEAARLVEAGVSTGVPDLIIITRPPICLSAPGAAIEMKRVSGGVVSDKQKDWIYDLEEMGWLTAICEGGWQAIKQLQEWGYPIKATLPPWLR